MSQTDGNSMGGESGPVGHTGTGCYKNHEHSMMLHPQQQHHGTAAANRLIPISGGQQRRASATTGAISIAAVTALLTSSPATNVSGIVQQQQPPPPTTHNNLVDLGKTTAIDCSSTKEKKDNNRPIMCLSEGKLGPLFFGGGGA
jgi:hypothetical protein